MRGIARTDDADKILDCIISIVNGIKAGKVTLAGDETTVNGPEAKGINEKFSVVLMPAEEEAAKLWLQRAVFIKTVGVDFFSIQLEEGTSSPMKKFYWIAVAR